MIATKVNFIVCRLPKLNCLYLFVDGLSRMLQQASTGSLIDYNRKMGYKIKVRIRS
jgi:hypothetical protein